MQRETLGNRHPNTLASINNLGALLYSKGDLAAAEPLLREALEDPAGGLPTYIAVASCAAVCSVIVCMYLSRARPS